MVSTDDRSPWRVVLAFFCAAAVLCSSTVTAYANTLDISEGSEVSTLDAIAGFFGTVANVFGVSDITAEDSPELELIASPYTRAQAWLNLYKEALGDTWDNVKEQFADAIAVYQTGTMEIRDDLYLSINRALKYGINQGIPIHGEAIAITQKNSLMNLVTDYLGFEGYNRTRIRDACERVFDAAELRWGVNNVTALVMQSYKETVVPNDNVAMICFYNVGDRLRLREENGTYTYYRNGDILMALMVYENGNYQTQSLDYCTYTPRDGFGFRTANFGEYAPDSRKHLITYSTRTRDAILGESQYLISPDTEIEDGEAVKASVMVRMPNGRVFSVYDVQNVTDVQYEVGLYPNSEVNHDLQEIIDRLTVGMTQNIGVTGSYRVGFLKKYFPFCIPWDVEAILTAFAASPQAPEVTFSLPVGYENGEIKFSEPFTISLAAFDSVAEVCRQGEKVLFILGLALVTRQMYIRG